MTTLSSMTTLPLVDDLQYTAFIPTDAPLLATLHTYMDGERTHTHTPTKMINLNKRVI